MVQSQTAWAIGTRLSSFLLKVLHDLLLTQERVLRTNLTEPGTCKLCTQDVIEDLEHALVIKAYE